MRVRIASTLTAVLLLSASCAAPRAPAAVVIGPPAPSTAEPPAPERSEKGADDGVFKPVPDTVIDDPSLPSGTVRVAVVNADGEPIPRASVTLEAVILHERSDGLDVVAKDTATADEKGVALFRKVRVNPDHRYMVSTRRGDGTFSVEPFKLSAKSGKRLVVHAYETVRELQHALVAMQTAVYLTVHADTIGVEVMHVMHNLGRTAWVPTGVRVAFPPNASDFLASDLGLSIGVDEITQAGFSLVGTLPPGKLDLHYRYQIPRDRSGHQRAVLDMPPRNALVRVFLDAGGAPQLTVAGFPAAKPTDFKGASLLMTERMAEKGEAGMKRLEITLAGDPR